MEVVNRYTQQHNSMMYTYVAFPLTGKAAVYLGGTSVHSAFKLTQSRQQDSLSNESLQSDEISMNALQSVQRTTSHSEWRFQTTAASQCDHLIMK